MPPRDNRCCRCIRALLRDPTARDLASPLHLFGKLRAQMAAAGRSCICCLPSMPRSHNPVTPCAGVRRYTYNGGQTGRRRTWLCGALATAGGAAGLQSVLWPPPRRGGEAREVATGNAGSSMASGAAYMRASRPPKSRQRARVQPGMSPQQVPNLTHVFWACAGPRARSDCIVATSALTLTTFGFCSV